MNNHTPPLYMHTAGLADPVKAAIDRSADAGGHEVRAHVVTSDAARIADRFAAVAEIADDFRRVFQGRDAGGRPWHVVLEVWP